MARVLHPDLPHADLALPTLLAVDLPPLVGALTLAGLQGYDFAVCTAHGALDGDGLVAKVGVVEDAADGFAIFLRLHKLTKELGDALDLSVAQFLAL